MKTYYNEEVQIPESIKIEVNSTIKIFNSQTKLERKLPVKEINIKKEDNKLLIYSNKKSRKYKRELYSALAHIKNMIEGLNKPYIYKLKVCSGHFPMSVKIEKNYVMVSNFLGEKIPRKALILPGVKVNLSGDIITVESPDLEKAGQTAANIETATKIKNRDRRVFQDGIFITNKAR